MPREVPEWIGKSDITPIPPRVRLRVFERHGGTCYLSKRKIRPGDDWDCDHIVALINGGENRESNLAPALRSAHREKTAQDVKIKAKAARLRKKHIGADKGRKRAVIPGSKASKWKQKIDGTVVLRD